EHLERLGKLSLGGKLGYVWNRSVRRGRTRSNGANASPLEERKILTDYPKVSLSHSIKPYAGTVTLLIDEESHAQFGDLGWGKVATGGLEIHVLPGDHLSYIREHG